MGGGIIFCREGWVLADTIFGVWLLYEVLLEDVDGFSLIFDSEDGRKDIIDGLVPEEFADTLEEWNSSLFGLVELQYFGDLFCSIN